MTLVIFALPEESAAFRRRLGRGENARVKICHSGIGAEAARAALARIAAQEQSTAPFRVISAGFAGALIVGLERGTMVTASNLGAPIFGVRAVRFLAAKAIIESAAERAALHAATGAEAVDLESGALAEMCAARGWPFAVLRVISDSVREPFPVAARWLAGPRWRLVAHLLAHPRALPAFARFARDGQRGGARLAEALRRELERP